MKLALIDLSGIAHRIWHVSGDEPDPNHVSDATAAECRRWADGYDRVAICCDSRTNKRKEVDRNYKANRDAKPEALFFQIDRAKRLLADDGYCVYEADGYEADDIIATLVHSLRMYEPGAMFSEARIFSADKDLLQLVSNEVSCQSTASKQIYTPHDVIEKFGVTPQRIPDWLALVGDAADNIKGCPGCGPVKASELLRKYQTVVAAVGAAIAGDEWIKPALRKSLADNKEAIAMAYALVSLYTNAPIDHKLLAAEQVRKEPEPMPGSIEDAAEAEWEESVGTDGFTPETLSALSGSGLHLGPTFKVGPTTNQGQEKTAVLDSILSGNVRLHPPTPETQGPAESKALARVDPEWAKALEPRNMKEALEVAGALFSSRLLGDVGSKDGALAVILAGREMGLGAMSSLRGIHVIKGKITLSAALMKGMILASGKCDYFECVESTAAQATYVAKRRRQPGESREPTELRFTFSMENARKAQLLNNPMWGKYPKNMLRWRCMAELAREQYPDVIHNCYLPEELE